MGGMGFTKTDRGESAFGARSGIADAECSMGWDQYGYLRGAKWRDNVIEGNFIGEVDQNGEI